MSKPTLVRPQHKSEERHITRERYFERRSDVMTLLNALHIEQSTGTLTIHFRNGGIQGAVFVEKIKVVLPEDVPLGPERVQV